MNARKLLVLVGVLSAACSKTPPAEEPDRPEPTGATHPEEPPKSTAAPGSLQANIEKNQADAEGKEWRKKDVVEVVPDRVAVVLYKKAHRERKAPRVARADLVTSGDYAPQSFVNGMIDVVRAPGGSFLWDLRGDKSTSVVLNLTPCSANCGVAKPKVIELVDGKFTTPAAAPECPTCIGDRDHDGIPEFEVALVRLDVAPCSRISCGPSLALAAEVRGFEMWDGKGYARELPALEPLYFEKLKRTRSDVQRARNASHKSKICPLGVLQTAAELFVYSRFIGESRADALRLADAVMKGYSLSKCTGEYELLAAPKSWPELRAELEVAKLPDLRRVQR